MYEDRVTLAPEEIQQYGQPIEDIYISMCNELMINIGRHINKPTRTTHTAVWEIQKLSELGQLTHENAYIISKWIKDIPEITRETLDATEQEALNRLERQMKEQLSWRTETPPIHESLSTAMRSYLAQTYDLLRDRQNLVNTTMLQSSVDQYTKAVHTAAEIAKVKEQAEATQKILNQKTANVFTGVDTLREAKRTAIRQIAKEGLTGFYDKAGRRWTPEAYVNMDIRTTVHRVAVDTIASGMVMNGVEVFQVSSHAAARPLCYPYQGKFYSWGGFHPEGDIELGDGRVVHFENVFDATSYGEPAGLFGINCGHYPIPIVPGVTIPHGADDIQPQEINDRQYKESQQQRAIEREIRAAKRDLEMLGDTATDEDRQRLKRAQEKMGAFISKTGRTRRRDREEVFVTTPGQARAAAKKMATAAAEPVQRTPAPSDGRAWSDKVKELRDSLGGARPTDEQLHEAGKLLADEYARERTNYTQAQKDLENESAEVAHMYGQLRWTDLPAAEKAGDTKRVEEIKQQMAELDAKQLRIRKQIIKNEEMYADLSEHWLASKLSEVRELGKGKSSVAQHLYNARGEYATIVKSVYELYPRDWVEASAKYDKINVIQSDRGFYRQNLTNSTLALSEGTKQHKRATAIHELGHRFEDIVQKILDTEAEFYKRRTYRQQLKQLEGYDTGEVAKKDKFIDPYMGKWYDGDAYELVSMGFELAYTDPEKLSTDPDYQEWIYGILLLE